jgi:glycosyltransferase involved in cell wall biosynthesis
MKIAILTPEYVSEASNWHGGLSNYLSRIAYGLMNRGHEIHILTYSNKQEIIDQNGIRIHRICANDYFFRVINGITLGFLYDILQIVFIAYYFKKYFLRIYKKENFDVIHSSSCQTPGLFLDSKKIGVPIVTRLSSITRLCQVVSSRRNKLDMYLLNAAEKCLARKSDKVFAPSNITKKNSLKEFNLEVDLIESPEYFPDLKEKDLDNFVYERYFKNKKYILFYGTLSKLKGSEYIADNIYYLLNQFQDYYFVMVGKMVPLKKNISPIELILNNAKEYRHRIIYTNSLRHEQLFPVMKNAQAILLPSMLDNFPNTVIESMSLEKIVIGTRDGGFDQLIDDGKNGFLVDYGDNQGLRKIFQIICRGGKDELSKIEKAAKKTVNERLNFNKKITELEKYYEQAIKDFKKTTWQTI